MQYLSIQELSKKLNVRPSWIRSKIFKKEIPFIKVGRLIRFDLKEIDSWINLNRTGGANE